MWKWVAMSAAVLLAVGVQGALAAETKPLEPLVISYVPANATHWGLDVARDEGFFRDAGFDVQVIPFQSSLQSIQLLVSGGAAIATVEPESLVSAVVHGATDLAAIAQEEYRPDWMLIGGRDIKSWTDLKGKRLGFSTLATGEFWLTEQLLAKHGLGKGTWSALQVGTSPAKFAALTNGSIAGSVLFQPLALKGVQQGLHVLAKFAEVGDFPPTLIPVRRSWAAKDKNGIRLGEALARSNRWLYDPKNRAAAMQILEKYTKCDAAIAGQLYQELFVTDKLYVRDAAVELKGLERVAGLMAQFGEIPGGKAPPPQSFVLAKEMGGLWH